MIELCIINWCGMMWLVNMCVLLCLWWMVCSRMLMVVLVIDVIG